LWLDAWLNDEVVWRGSTVSEGNPPIIRLRERYAAWPAYAIARRLTSRRRRRSPGR
jgi:hypothetical protein